MLAWGYFWGVPLSSAVFWRPRCYIRLELLLKGFLGSAAFGGIAVMLVIVGVFPLVWPPFGGLAVMLGWGYCWGVLLSLAAFIGLARYFWGVPLGSAAFGSYAILV
ncbi:hypothetical protein TYRP_023310, partial [Tyrophagus putrescentiae]